MNKEIEKKFDEEFGDMTIEDNKVVGVWLLPEKLKEGSLPIFNSEAIKSFIDKHFIAKEEVQQVIKDGYKAGGVFSKQDIDAQYVLRCDAMDCTRGKCGEDCDICK